MDMLEKMQPVFRRVFRQPELVLQRDMAAGNVKGWDSLSHIHLVVELERAFGIVLKTRDLAGLKNVGEMAAVLEARMKK